MPTTKPPPRPACLFDIEQGMAPDQARIQLLYALGGQWLAPLTFTGDAAGTVHTTHLEEDGARIDIRSSHGDGIITVALDRDNWLRADIQIHGHALRVWIERPYEEFEAWPDGATGEGEPPVRISKRGRWLQVDRQLFPALSGEGYWTLEDASA